MRGLRTRFRGQRVLSGACAAVFLAGLAVFPAALPGRAADDALATVRPEDTGVALLNPDMGWTMHFYSNVPENYGSKQREEVCGKWKIGAPGSVCGGCSEARRRAVSKIGDQVANANLECAGDPDQGMNAYGLLAALDFANVHGMQVGFFSQFLLRKAASLSVLTNSLADNFPLSWRCWHCRPDKQESGL